MIPVAFARAWDDLFRPRILGTVLKGIGLTLLLFIILQGAISYGIQWLAPESLTLPLIGEIAPGRWLAMGSFVLLPLMAFFLMAPVAAAFAGLFAETVVIAVEEIHYPDFPGQPLDFWDGLIESLALAGLMVAVALGLLILSPFLGPLMPVLLYGANGWLLGREFFQMAARRHLSEAEATAMRRRLSLQVTGFGVVMAVLLSVPLLNILVPTLAAAGFSHLFHLSRTFRPDRRG